jgi:hypothetical protein
MREFRTYGSVRGASGDRCPYRDSAVNWRRPLLRISRAQPLAITRTAARAVRMAKDYGAVPGPSQGRVCSAGRIPPEPGTMSCGSTTIRGPMSH